MQLTLHYNSIDNDKSARRNQKNCVSPFAQETFDAFAPFINIFDAGADFDGPYHTITKLDWELFRRHKSGEKPLFYDDGTEFNPYKHVLRNIYGPEHVQKHIGDHEQSYYTSGRHGLGMFYLDTDAHHPWQTDEYEAKSLLQKLFPFGYYRASSRGQNGYLKIRYSSISEFNEAAHKLEATLKRLFLDTGILCDIEIKGTITHERKSGLLAKLPFNTKNDQYKRDETDSWDGNQLELFKNCPTVNLQRIERIREQVARLIDDDKAKRFLEHKNQVAAKSLVAEEVRRNLRWQGGDDELVSRLKKHLAAQIREQTAWDGSDKELISRIKAGGGKAHSLLSGVATPDMSVACGD